MHSGSKRKRKEIIPYRDDLSSILNSLMELHRRRDPEDYRSLQSHLNDHGKAVYEYMQDYRAERRGHSVKG